MWIYARSDEEKTFTEKKKETIATWDTRRQVIIASNEMNNRKRHESFQITDRRLYKNKRSKMHYTRERERREGKKISPNMQQSTIFRNMHSLARVATRQCNMFLALQCTKGFPMRFQLNQWLIDSHANTKSFFNVRNGQNTGIKIPDHSIKMYNNTCNASREFVVFAVFFYHSCHADRTPKQLAFVVWVCVLVLLLPLFNFLLRFAVIYVVSFGFIIIGEIVWSGKPTMSNERKNALTE